MSWMQAVVSAASALAGGFVGGWVVAFRLGRWRQMVEDRLAGVERRLEKGNARVDAVPIIQTRLDVLIEEFRGFRKELREDFKLIVTREECDRRHGDGE